MVSAPNGINAHETEQEELPLALSLSFDKNTNLIDFTLYEHTDFSDEPIPLKLKYEYHPECGFAPSESLSQSSTTTELMHVLSSRSYR